jgi:hypothetical protein
MGGHYAVMGGAVHYAVMGGAAVRCGGAAVRCGGGLRCRKKFAKRPPRLQFACTFFLYIKKLFITHLVKLFTLCTLPRNLKCILGFRH